MRHILFASDFSRASRRAFTAAVKAARDAHATLTIVHVMTPYVPIALDQYVGPETWEQIETDARKWATTRLNALASRAKAAGVRAKVLLCEGQAAREVTRLARKMHADEIVIGTHGRTGFAKLLLGSVASRIVATSTCPVLTVRG